MCTSLSTGCIRTTCGGLFFLGPWPHHCQCVNVNFFNYEEGRVNSINHYEFWCLVCLAKIDSKNLVAAIIWFQHFNAEESGIRMDIHQSLLFQKLPKKGNEWKQNIYTDYSISTRKSASKKSFSMKALNVNGDTLEPGGEIACSIPGILQLLEVAP